jgi:predicted transcriptional regulator
MQQPTVKLTLRLPAALHEKLRQRARASDQSLNAVIVEAMQQGLEAVTTYPEESEREKVQRVLRENGLIEPLGSEWKKYTQNAPEISHAALRAMLNGVAPLSDAIIEERDSRE